MTDVQQAFHKLWTKAAYQDDYEKKDWMELSRLIERLEQIERANREPAEKKA